ncbi:FmdB family zinc ribbon protein [Candidatus Palauibacter sp.]|uniref:FmdB family zinc ribbon protein n=1 Tax=Candidatus Palauibacter sp. TaxID=3101350 RepID=UPI003B01012F
MPTYEYRCGGCRHAFERFQRMSDAPVRLCPSCGERRVERLISAGGGIVFKGAGFYATDYRQPESGGREASGSETASDAGEAGAGAGADGSRNGGKDKGEGGGADSGAPGEQRRGGETGS